MPESQAAFAKRLNLFTVARPRRFSPDIPSGPLQAPRQCQPYHDYLSDRTPQGLGLLLIVPYRYN